MSLKKSESLMGAFLESAFAGLDAASAGIVRVTLWDMGSCLSGSRSLEKIYSTVG